MSAETIRARAGAAESLIAPDPSSRASRGFHPHFGLALLFLLGSFLAGAVSVLTLGSVLAILLNVAAIVVIFLAADAVRDTVPRVAVGMLALVASSTAWARPRYSDGPSADRRTAISAL
jgi:hypothetical protein